MPETEAQHRVATLQRQAAFAAWALRGANKGTVSNYAVLVSRNGALCIYDAGTFETAPRMRYAIYHMVSHAVAYVGAENGRIVRVTDPDQIAEQPLSGPTFNVPDKGGKHIMYATSNCVGTGPIITARKGQPFYICGTTLRRTQRIGAVDHSDVFIPVAAMSPIYPGQAYGLIKLSMLSNTIVPAPKLELGDYAPFVDFAPNPTYEWLNTPLATQIAYKRLRVRHSDSSETKPFIAVRATGSVIAELKCMAAECWELARFATPDTAWIGMLEAARLWSMCDTSPVPNALQIAFNAYTADHTGWQETGLVNFKGEAQTTYEMWFLDGTSTDKIAKKQVLEKISDDSINKLVNPKMINLTACTNLGVGQKYTVVVNNTKAVATLKRLRHLPANALDPTAAAVIKGFKQGNNRCYTVHATQREDGLFEVGAAGSNKEPLYKKNDTGGFVAEANPKSTPWVDGTATNVVRTNEGHTLLYGYVPNVTFHDEAVHDHYSTFLYTCGQTDAFPPTVTANSQTFLNGMWCGDTITRTGRTQISVIRRSVCPEGTVQHALGIELGPDHTNTHTVVVTKGPLYQKEVVWVNGVYNPMFPTNLHFTRANIKCKEFVECTQKPNRKCLTKPSVPCAELKLLLVHNINAAYAPTDQKGKYRAGPFKPEGAVYIKDLGLLPHLSDCNVVMAATISFTVTGTTLPSKAELTSYIASLNIKDYKHDPIETNHVEYKATSTYIRAIFNLSTAFPTKGLTRRGAWQTEMHTQFQNEAAKVPWSETDSTLSVDVPVPCLLPMDRITAINGFSVNTQITTNFDGLAGWVTYTRNNDSRIQPTPTTTTLLTNTSMFFKDHSYYNAAEKPLPPTRLYALRKEDTAEEIATPVEEVDEEELITLVLPKAPVVLTNDTSTVVVFEPHSTTITPADNAPVVLMDWDTGFNANFLRQKYLVGLLPTPGKTLRIFCTSQWYAPRASSSAAEVFSAVATAAVAADAHFTIIVATQTVHPFCIMPSCLKYTNNNEECYGQLTEKSHIVPAITISRTSTRPIKRKTTIPDSSITGPILKAVQRAQQLALAEYATIDKKRTALGASTRMDDKTGKISFSGENPYPNEKSIADDRYKERNELPYIDDKKDDRTKLVQAQWVKDYTFAIAMGTPTADSKCELVWAKAHEQCTFSHSAPPLGEWGPAYTISKKPTVLQFPSTTVTYPEASSALNKISISTDISDTVSNAGTDTQYRLSNPSLVKTEVKGQTLLRMVTEKTLVPRALHTTEAAGLRCNDGVMYTWPELAKTFVACMAEKTHTGTYDSKLVTPFVVTPHSVAFTDMGLCIGAVVTNMTNTSCTTRTADTAHADPSKFYAESTARRTVQISAGHRLVIKWEQVKNTITKFETAEETETFEHRESFEHTGREYTFRYTMRPDTDASSPEALDLLPPGYNWVLAVNNLTSFEQLGKLTETLTLDKHTEPLIFDHGAIVTLGKTS